MDYTTADLVKLQGDVAQDTDDVLLTKLVTGYSRQVDGVVHQVFGTAVYADQVQPAHIDRDGVLMVYPPVPTLAAPTAFAWRYGNRSTWLDIALSLLEVEARPAGAVVRVLDSDYSDYRGQRVMVRMSYTGGYATIADLPADFELSVRQLVWWGYKLREAPMHKTAIPALGEVVVPSDKWPGYIRQGLRPFVRRTI